MWIRLDDAEIQLILRSIPDGPLATKLKEQPDPGSGAFSSAVETNDELEVDDDAVISRGEEGAFVMSWVWVSNEQAGITMDEHDDDRLGVSP